MSLVVVLGEERFRERLQALAAGAQYHLLTSDEAGAEVPARVRELLQTHQDLALVVSEQFGQNWIQALDGTDIRYWLVEIGSPSASDLVQSVRRPHRHLVRLDHVASAYLEQLLDDWRDRERARVDCFSFGFRAGLPNEADWILDARFLDSPYWIPSMRERPGSDPDVRAYVMSQPGARELVEKMVAMLTDLLPLYQKQRRSVLRIGVGCTGGLHRSVAIASELVDRINQSNQADARLLPKAPPHLPRALD